MRVGTMVPTAARDPGPAFGFGPLVRSGLASAKRIESGQELGGRSGCRAGGSWIPVWQCRGAVGCREITAEKCKRERRNWGMYTG